MSTLATIAAGGILALLTAAAITIAMGRADDRLGHLLPAEPGDDEPGPGIRVNPGRPEGDL